MPGAAAGTTEKHVIPQRCQHNADVSRTTFVKTRNPTQNSGAASKKASQLSQLRTYTSLVSLTPQNTNIMPTCVLGKSLATSSLLAKLRVSAEHAQCDGHKKCRVNQSWSGCISPPLASDISSLGVFRFDLVRQNQRTRELPRFRGCAASGRGACCCCALRQSTLKPSNKELRALQASGRNMDEIDFWR